MGDGSWLHHDIGANPNGLPEQVLVGFVNVNQLIRLVDRYSNNELFEKNVRLFLGTGKEVNRSIIQTINGCQTVNALYHAKYSPELKDRFQGNSNVLVRIYQIAPQNKPFLDAL